MMDSHTLDVLRERRSKISDELSAIDLLLETVGAAPVKAPCSLGEAVIDSMRGTPAPMLLSELTNRVNGLGFDASEAQVRRFVEGGGKTLFREVTGKKNYKRYTLAS